MDEAERSAPPVTSPEAPSWFQNLIQEMKKEITSEVKQMMSSKEWQNSQLMTASLSADTTSDNVTNDRRDTTVTDQTVHKNIICDNCDNKIRGVRYKCGNCVDYDLCTACEPHADEIHNKEHVFIKLRRHTNKAGKQSDGTRVPLLSYNIYQEYATPVVIPELDPSNKACCENCNVEHVRNAVRKLEKLKRKDEKLRHKAHKLKKKEEKIQRQLAGSRGNSTSQGKQAYRRDEMYKSKRLGCNVLKDESSPTKTLLTPGQKFVKKWQVKNSGDVKWSSDVKVVFVKGTLMPSSKHARRHIKVPRLNPGETGTISVEMRPPAQIGLHRGVYKLSHNGKVFPHRLECVVEVRDAVTSLEPDPTRQQLTDMLLMGDSANKDKQSEDDQFVFLHHEQELSNQLKNGETKATKTLIESLGDLRLNEDSSSPVRISFSAAGDDDEVTPLLSVPSMTAGSGDVTPVRITPLASQTATPHNTPLILSPPKSPEPSDSVLHKQYNYLDILSEEDSDLEDLCLIGGRPRISRPERNDFDVISLSSTTTDDEDGDADSVYSDCNNEKIASDLDYSESEEFFMVPVPSCFNANVPLDQSLIEMKVLTRTSSSSSQTTLDDILADETTHEDIPVEQSMISSSRFVPANTQSVLDKINNSEGQVDGIMEPTTALICSVGDLTQATPVPAPVSQANVETVSLPQCEAKSDTVSTHSAEAEGAGAALVENEQSDDKPPSDVAVLPDTIEDVAEFALEKVLEAGSGVAKTVMNFLRDLEEYQPPQSEWQPKTSDWKPQDTEPEAGYDLPNKDYIPKASNWVPPTDKSWAPKPDDYKVKLSQWKPAQNDSDLVATVTTVHVKERVKSKLCKMGFVMNPQVESMIDTNLKSKSDVDQIISAVIGEMMKEIS